MHTFVDLPGGKGVAGGIVKDDAEYILKYIQLTDYNRVRVADGKRVGIAELGKAEQFDLLNGKMPLLITCHLSLVTPHFSSPP
ncbi:MAG TPA: hypothetical protein VFZ76_19600 [Anaerolineales bacterium]